MGQEVCDMYSDRLDEKIKQYLTDYKANVLVPREIEDFEGLKTKLRQLFEVLKVAGNEEEMEKVLREDEKFKSIDNETAQAISIFARMDIKVIGNCETKNIWHICEILPIVTKARFRCRQQTTVLSVRILDT